MTYDGAPMNDLDPSVTTTLALTAVARERRLTSAGERPFDFADELAEILAAVNARIGGTDELFVGRPTSDRTELITTLIAAGTARRPGPDRGTHEATVYRAIVAATDLARQSGAYIDDDGRSPFPFADELTDALSRVTASLGGPAELFAGQSATSNAKTVAELLGTTLPEDLPAYRSEPVRVLLDVNDQFEESGLQDHYHWVLQGLWSAVLDERLPDQYRLRATATYEAIRAGYSAQKSAYAETYIRTAPQVAEQLGLHAPIEVFVGHHDDPAAPAEDPLTREVTQALTQATIVPGTGRPPRERRPGRRPADLPGVAFRARTSVEPRSTPSQPAPTLPPPKPGLNVRPATVHPSRDHRSDGLQL
ncbi:hypothetical protein [Jiangella anatolica]|uniref:Uncharacterized protein n=1 Tax=Jiangella anatolica TaxID=2670374 RepID=A0A2W2C1U7_9ACTN|nr:hypothetical protein [Jiangella anatolica]PZF86058.1 hypothetical protein C1I92_02410 [Jiangella anatolica]